MTIGAPRVAGDIPALCDRLRAMPVERDAELVCDLGRLADADAATVEALARLQLVARRHACRVRLRDASPRIRELLELVGLSEVLPCEPHEASGVEVQRQPEEREVLRGVEEEGDSTDPIA